ncbi:MAG: hypothetical protein QXR27_00190 [Archaeoglobaceae archaeon]
MAKKVLITFLVFLTFVMVILYHSSFSALTPSDLIMLDHAYNVAVRGKVENVVLENGFTKFYISDNSNKIKALYIGEITSNEIIAIGDWKDGIFYVREVLKKCHTEYGG